MDGVRRWAFSNFYPPPWRFGANLSQEVSLKTMFGLCLWQWSIFRFTRTLHTRNYDFNYKLSISKFVDWFDIVLKLVLVTPFDTLDGFAAPFCWSSRLPFNCNMRSYHVITVWWHNSSSRVIVTVKPDSHRGDHICRLGQRNLIVSGSSPKVHPQSIPTNSAHSVLSSSPFTKWFFFSSLATGLWVVNPWNVTS